MEQQKKVTKEQALAEFNKFIDESKYIYVSEDDKKSDDKDKK